MDPTRRPFREWRRRTLPMLFVGLLLLPRSSSFAEVELTSQSNITIQEEGPFDTAAGLLPGILEKYLLAALGKEKLPGPGTECRFLIETEADYWNELPRATIRDMSDADAFEIAISSSPSPQITISGRTPLAAGHGVMYFLEKHLGLLWAFPGDLGLCLPERQSFHLKEGTEKVSPWVAARAMSGLVLREKTKRKGAPRPMSGVAHVHRNFFLAEDYFKSLRFHPGTIHHNMINIFPVERSKAEHPEIFPVLEDGNLFVPPLKDSRVTTGKRAWQPWHPCYSNPKTLEIAIEKGRQYFASGTPFFSLGINDGHKVQCQCEACVKEGWPQSYYRFVIQVAEALKEHYPPQMVGVLAYGDVGKPPADLKLPENVLVNVAGMRKAAWESLAPALGTYEYIYGNGFVIPNLPLDVIQENFRYYQKHNLKMYYAELYPLWAFDAPKAYIISRLLWDPEQDVYQLLRDFCDRVFGKAGDAMYRYYATAAATRKDDARPGAFTSVWGKIWPFRNPLQFYRCPTDLHSRLNACLVEAKAAGCNDRQHDRIAMVEAFTEYSSIYHEIYRLKESVFAGKAEAKETASRVVELKERRDRIATVFEDHPEWFKGTSVTAEELRNPRAQVVWLEQQLKAAAAAADLAMAEGSEGTGTPIWSEARLSASQRSEHPWYKPSQNVRMESSRTPDRGFQFQSAPNVVILPDEDSRYHGRPKAQWLEAKVQNLPVRNGILYVLNADLTGTGGTLQLTLRGAMRGVTPSPIFFARTLQAFAETDSSEKASRRVVIDPIRYLESAAFQNAAETPLNLQLHLHWRPDTESANLQGKVALKQVELLAEL